MWPFVHKRKSFEHERELRALTQQVPSVGKVLDLGADSPTGMTIKVEVPTLVENIYVAPYAEQWFVDLVSATARRYRLGASVRQSSLDSDPVF
jgi:hypothetical protein